MRVIAGSARSIPLRTRDGLDTRPTADRVKEAMFSIIQFEIAGARVLDLFGGSGQLAIESLSRGAREAVIVDAATDSVRIIRENLKRTRLEDKAQVIRTDYLNYLSNCKSRFDLIFLDPPYAENFLETAIKRISEIDILNSGGIIICERAADRPLIAEAPGLLRSRDYRYGKTAVTLLRRQAVADP